MRIKDIISQGKAYFKVVNIDFKVNKNNLLTLDDLIESIDNLKLSLINSDDDYNNILFIMLSDKYLIEGIKDNYNNGLNIYDALHNTIDFYKSALVNSNDEYLNQRAIDLDNLEYMIVSNLNNHNYPKLEEDLIICCEEILPSFLIDNLKHIKGIVALKGGQLAHTAILARAHGIPYVLVDGFDFDYSKTYYINTETKIICDKYIKDFDLVDRVVNISDVIKDTGIKIYANVFSNDDINKVIKYNFSGIGLYRTEFIFMSQNKPMSKELQQSIYTEAATMMHPKQVVFRTFDLGDDKKVDYIKTSGKGVLNYIDNLDVFNDHIEAIVRANTNNNVSIMFPMIRTIDEFRLLKNIVIDICHKTNSNIPNIGMMLETKEALNNLNEFKEVGFISIGTNDLTKELYNIDREDISRLELYYDDLLQRLILIKKFCDIQNIKLSICGEIAALESVSKDLLSYGFTNYSVSPECFRPILLNINRNK